MNWTELYNRVVFEVYGNSVPAQGTQNVLQGEYGIIANAHRKIQEDYNYWFMESTELTTLTDGVRNYPLPALFKEVVQNGFRMVDTVSGNYCSPISPMQPNDAFNHFRNATEEVDYPTHYEIYGGELLLYPTPALTGVVLAAKIYKYLPRPPAVFDLTYDALTRNGHNAVIYEAAANICRIQEEYQKMQVFQGELVKELERLMQMDARMRRAENNTVLYAGL